MDSRAKRIADITSYMPDAGHLEWLGMLAGERGMAAVWRWHHPDGRAVTALTKPGTSAEEVAARLRAKLEDA